MPVGVTLLELRRDLRAETGTSLNPAQGTAAQETLDIIIARQQRELWDAYNWQHLKIWTDMPLMPGQSVYTYPREMAFDQITKIYVATITLDPLDPLKILAGSDWKPLTYGVKANMQHLGPAETGEPSRWRNKATVDISLPVPVTNPVGQLEIMPTPPSVSGNTMMVLRFEGMAPLSPLIAPSDTCILDSKAIVLFAAAEIMATQKSEAAPMKLTKAQNYLRRLLADQGGDKRQNYNMGGNQRGGIDPDKGWRRHVVAR